MGLDTITNEKYKQIIYYYSDKIPTWFDNYLDVSLECLCSMLNVPRNIVVQYIRVALLKKSVKNLMENINIVKAYPELLGDINIDEQTHNLVKEINSIYDMIYKDDKAYDNVINYIVFPSRNDINFETLRAFMYAENSGNGLSSEKKIKTALNTLQNVSYTNQQLSSKIHKVKYFRSSDLRSTTYNILFERYSTAHKTKIVFCKLPLSENTKMAIQLKLHNTNFENIYYATGMGIVADAGYSEDTLYSAFVNNTIRIKDELQVIADMANDKDGKYADDLIKLILKSNMNIASLASENNIKMGVK